MVQSVTIPVPAGTYSLPVIENGVTIQTFNVVVGGGHSIKPGYSGEITDISKNADGTSDVTITGNSAGTYNVPTGPLEAGEQVWLVPSTVLGTGPWTQGSDGVYIQQTTPTDPFERMAIKVINGSPIQDSMAFFEVIGLGDKERALFGFQWTFDDAGAGDFEHLDPNFPAGRDKNTDTGFATGHCWDTHGTKTVSCVVTQRLDDGATRAQTLSVDVVVQDKEIVFPVADRWVVGAEAGDTVPAGTVVNTIEEALQAIRLNDGGWLQVRGGKSYPIASSSNPRTDQAPVRIDTWNGRATLNLSGERFLNMSNEEQPTDMVVKGFDIAGPYDPATGVDNGLNADGIRVRYNSRLTVNSCTFSGCQTAVTIFGDNADEATDRHGFFDCLTTKWENFGCYSDSTGALCRRGSKIAQDQSAVNGDESRKLDDSERNYPDHGPMRDSRLNGLTVIHSVEGFSANGWTTSNDPGAPAGKVALMAHQPFWRAGSLEVLSTARLTMSGCYCEGGSGLSLNGSATDGIERGAFTVIDSTYLMSSANTPILVRYGNTRAWLTNNVIVFGDVLAEHNNAINPMTFDESLVPQSGWLDYEINDINNTVAVLISPGNLQNASRFESDQVLGLDEQGATVNVSNQVFIIPNATLNDETGPRDADGPLDMTELGMPARYLGQRRANADNSTATTDTQFATRQQDIITGKLAAGSPALGGASGDIPALDFAGNVRGSSTARGAYDNV